MAQSEAAQPLVIPQLNAGVPPEPGNVRRLGRPNDGHWRLDVESSPTPRAGFRGLTYWLPGYASVQEGLSAPIVDGTTHRHRTRHPRRERPAARRGVRPAGAVPDVTTSEGELLVYDREVEEAWIQADRFRSLEACR